MANNRFLEAAEKWKNESIPVSKENPASAQKENSISLPKKNSLENSLENVLIFSLDNDIYALDKSNNAIKIHSIKSPWRDPKLPIEHLKRIDKALVSIEGITNLVFHNDNLYHIEREVVSYGRHVGHYIEGGPNYEWTLVETFSKKTLARTTIEPQSLCSHRGRLYDSHSSAVYDTLRNEPVNAHASGRDFARTTLFSHKGDLNIAGGLDIHRVLDDEKRFSRKPGYDEKIFSKKPGYDEKILSQNPRVKITGACSYKDKIYFSTPFSVECTEDKDILSFGFSKSQTSANLCNHGGDFFLTVSRDLGTGTETYEIYNASLNKSVYESPSSEISSLCSVPKQFLLKNGVNLS